MLPARPPASAVFKHCGQALLSLQALQAGKVGRWPLQHDTRVQQLPVIDDKEPIFRMQNLGTI